MRKNTESQSRRHSEPSACLTSCLINLTRSNTTSRNTVLRMLGREPSYMSNEEIVGAILFGSASPVRARRFETASECSREEV